MARRPSSLPPQGVPLVDLAALGERLKRWRQWRGVSQATCARLAGVDAMVLSRLEAQHKPGRAATIAAIAQSLTAWEVRPFGGRLPWKPEAVKECLHRYTHGTKQARRALLLEYGFTAEARQHGAWWQRQRARAPQKGDTVCADSLPGLSP
jgi:transcriptional regulator with XRE-family HTH domain